MLLCEERTRLQNIILVILAGMIVLFGVLTAISRTQKGLVFEETLLKQTVTAESTVYTGNAYDEDIVVTVTPNPHASMTEVVFQIGNRIKDICTVQTGLPDIQTETGRTVTGICITKNDAILFEGGYSGEELAGWYDQNGEWRPQIKMGFDTGGNHWIHYETSAEDVMRFAEPSKLATRGSWSGYVVVVIVTLIMMVDVAFPRVFFELDHCCDVRDPEPSDFYLIMQKIGWVVFPFFLLIVYCIMLREIV